MNKNTAEQTGCIASIVGGNHTYTAAFAGTGKTHCMIDAVVELHKKEPRRSILLTSYNVRIRQEIEDRLLKKLSVKKLPDVIAVRTLNSLGFGVLAANSFWGKNELKTDGFKVQSMVREAMADASVMRVLALAAEDTGKVKLDSTDYAKLLEELINTSKIYGMRPEVINAKSLIAILDATLEKVGLAGVMIKPTAALAKLVANLMNYNIDLAREGLIDFNDQIYLAALYCANPGRQWATVVCDEFQDCSYLHHTLVRRASKQQLVFFGDPHQLIFKSVTGASISPMTSWLEQQGDKVSRHTLTTTFRCARLIAARQVEFGPLKKFVTAGGAKAPLGRLSFPYLNPEIDWAHALKHNNLIKPRWSFNKLVHKKKLRDGSVGFLAAQNSVLIEAMALAHKEKADFLKADTVYCGQTYPMTRWNLAANYQTRPAKAPTAIIGAMAFFLQQTGMLPAEAAKAFDTWKQAPFSEDKVVFSTVHGWKGRECDTIYLMEPSLLERDANVKYVAETRARTHLATLDLQTNKTASAAVGYFTDTGRKPISHKAQDLIKLVTNSIPSAYRIPSKTVISRVTKKGKAPVFVKDTLCPPKSSSDAIQLKRPSPAQRSKSKTSRTQKTARNSSRRGSSKTR